MPKGTAPAVSELGKGVRYKGMDTTIKRWTQIYIFAAAALLIVAMAAVTLTAGPAQAEGNVGGGGPLDPYSRPDNNEEGYSDFGAIPCSEESEPDENTVSVIRGSTAEDAPRLLRSLRRLLGLRSRAPVRQLLPPGG